MKARSIYGLMGMFFSSSLLGIAFLLGGYETASLLSVIIFLIHLIPPIRSTKNGINLYFSANLALAATGAVLDLSIEILIFAVITALVGWDLSLFAQEESCQPTILKDEQAVLNHIKTLITVAIIGLTVAFASSISHYAISFIPTMMLSFLGLACLAVFYLIFNAR